LNQHRRYFLKGDEEDASRRYIPKSSSPTKKTTKKSAKKEKHEKALNIDPSGAARMTHFTDLFGKTL